MSKNNNLKSIAWILCGHLIVKRQGKLCKAQRLPLPPVLVRMSDKDDSALTVLGQAALRAKALDIDRCSHRHLNETHTPYWHALDGDEEIDFQPPIDFSWVDRPRLLAAAGYSSYGLEEHSGTVPSPLPIETARSMQVKLNLDLLGIRAFNPLEREGAELSMVMPGAGVLKVDLDQRFNCAGLQDSEGAEAFRKKMCQLVAFSDEKRSEEEEGSEVEGHRGKPPLRALSEFLFVPQQLKALGS